MRSTTLGLWHRAAPTPKGSGVPGILRANGQVNRGLRPRDFALQPFAAVGEARGVRRGQLRDGSARAEETSGLPLGDFNVFARTQPFKGGECEFKCALAIAPVVLVMDGQLLEGFNGQRGGAP